jgi:hypothetical protein
MIRYTTAMTDAARRATDFPAFCRAAPPDPINLTRQPRGHFLAIALLPNFIQSIRAQYRATTEYKIAALALAAGLYASDHQGAWPTQTDQLLPQYLPYIPFDPMAPDGQPLHLKSANGAAQIYSTGEDATDDGGSTVPNPNNPNSANPDRWTRRDVVITLRRARPTTTPAKTLD